MGKDNLDTKKLIKQSDFITLSSGENCVATIVNDKLGFLVINYRDINDMAYFDADDLDSNLVYTGDFDIKVTKVLRPKNIETLLKLIMRRPVKDSEVSIIFERETKSNKKEKDVKDMTISEFFSNIGIDSKLIDTLVEILSK